MSRRLMLVEAWVVFLVGGCTTENPPVDNVQQELECRGAGDCPAGQTCCGGTCVFTGSDPLNCGACGVQCANGMDCCAGSCVPTHIDENNCGRCGNQCMAGQTCCASACVSLGSDTLNCGACGVQCPNGMDCCSGSCVPTHLDENNCGRCGNQCPTNQFCCESSCVFASGYRCGQDCTECHAVLEHCDCETLECVPNPTEGPDAGSHYCE